MIDMANVRVRRVNGEGIVYGDPFEPEDLPAAVAEEVTEDVLATGDDCGGVEVGGQRYWWAKPEPKAPPRIRPEHTDRIKEWLNVAVAEVDEDGDVWVEDPCRGHWLELEAHDAFLEWLANQ